MRAVTLLFGVLLSGNSTAPFSALNLNGKMRGISAFSRAAFFSVLFSGAEQQDLLDGPARLSLLPGLLRPAAPVLIACCFLAAVGEQQDANQASASKWKFWRALEIFGFQGTFFRPSSRKRQDLLDVPERFRGAGRRGEEG
jgi:hypothetical protein